MSRTDDPRAQIATEQAALVRALIEFGPAPGGFDSSALHATAASLARKRMRAVARAWPSLAQALGPRLVELFEGYAQGEALPVLGGPMADGRAFVRWLASRGELPEAGLLEAMAVDLHYRATVQGLVPRRWPTFQIAWLRQSHRVIAGIWLPGLGEHWLRLPP
jgi:hypothetical protein